MGGRRGTVSARQQASTRVLVAEDQQDTADFLRAYFRASGYDLVHVDPTSARHVMARLREVEPDCVLLDVHLRGFSGLEAYRLLRDDPAFDLVPVVLLTADTTAHVRAVGVAGGLDAFVQKPFSVRALERVVAGRVARARELAGGGGRDERGVAGERYVPVRLADELRAATSERRSVSFALVRLQGASEVRRAHGEEVLDLATRALTEHIAERVPPGAVLGRTGAGELAVILPGMATTRAERVLRRVLRSLPPVTELPRGPLVPLAVSAGLAAAPRHAATADQLYMAADAALADAADRAATLVVAR